MKLYDDGGKIVVGVAIFVILLTLPIWYNLFATAPTTAPELVLPDKSVHPNCVAPTDYMRPNHMDLLNDWRDQVVREGVREFTADDGKKYDMSLSRTCLDCHANKVEFCDRCHDYMGVHPYCWECHVE